MSGRSKIQQLRDHIDHMEPDELRTQLRRALFCEAENYARWQDAEARCKRYRLAWLSAVRRAAFLMRVPR